MPVLRKRLVWIAVVGMLGAAAAMTVFSRPRGERSGDPARPARSGVPVDTGRRDAAEPFSPLRFSRMPVAQTGIDVTYYGSPSDEHYLFEQNGGGAAVWDLDGDGRLDVFLTNGSHFERPAEGAGASQRLYRQIDDWRFADVTAAAGLQAWGFGQGCAAGDFDNDGFADLFVANYGPNRLWRNNGDGTFTEVTVEAGIGDERWATGAAFADLDGDGHLDLYVVNYVDWKPEKTPEKRIPSPMKFAGLPDLLYRNTGDGRFVEMGTEAGVSIAGEGKGLALAVGDLDGDRLPDIYVANDTTRNFLFRNRGGLRFEEIGVQSGTAVSQDGSIGSSMGVALGDYNRDGRPDLFVTNFAEEVVDAFTSLGPAGFAANNAELGIDASSRPMLNFGIILADFDLDHWPDLFFTNGHLWDETAAGGQYRMKPNLLRNLQGRRFLDVSAAAGEYFRQRWLGRAVACGDLDNDGDADLVVTHLEEPPALLRNDSVRGGDSLRLKLIGTRTARQALGARIAVRIGGGWTAAHVPSGESFQASHDDRVLVATGAARFADEVRVDWPGGAWERWADVPVGKLVHLIEGTGAVVNDP